MMELLQALESSAFSMWIKESSTAYVAILAFHTVGLSFLVGISGAVAMRVFGIARAIPLEPMQDFFPLMWTGLRINAFTGALLLCLYPTQYVTDYIIYIKLTAVVAAVLLLRRIQLAVFGEGVVAEAAAAQKDVRQMCGWMLAAWLLATFAGRVTAYSLPTRLQTLIAVLVFMIGALLVVYYIGRSRGWFGGKTDATGAA